MKSISYSLICFLFLCSISTLLTAQNNLSVGDPRQGFSTRQGTIEEASLAIRNKGLYLEYGLYLSFSAKGSNYLAKDSLEVVLNFTLPENAIVTDSWLWIYNDICKAKILDVWSARNIYENIVKRRTDPSLLLKTGPTSYQLRVFPMGGKETRKVKITYLLPLSWGAERVNAALPTHILNTSRFVVGTFPILIWNHPDFKNPIIENYNPFGFKDGHDPIWGDYKSTTLYSTSNYPAITLSYSSPMKNGFYMNYYNGPKESYYQVAIRPAPFTVDANPRKIAFLLDYHEDAASISKENFINLFKAEIKNYLSERDSFNIFFSGLNIQKYSDTWEVASKENLDQSLEDMNKLSNFSSMPLLIITGLQFINANKGDGKLMLLSNSNQFGSNDVSNEIIKNINSINIHHTQIDVLDYCKKFIVYLINGRNYYNNQYLYTNISNFTGGHYITMTTTFTNSLNEIFQLNSPKIKGFDFYLKVNQGITYGKFPLTPFVTELNVNSTYIQTGLFRGSFPFTIEMSGEINGSLFYKQFTIDLPEVFEEDSVSATVWEAQGLFKLEEQANDNAKTQAVIQKSIENRILTKYTAFLCLEDPSLYCHNCFDETEIPTDTDDEKLDSLQHLEVFPNPFSDQIAIEIHSDQSVAQKEWHGEIFDLSGRVVHRFTLRNSFKDSILQYIWNGNSDTGQSVANGTYILMLRNEKNTLHRKIIKM